MHQAFERVVDALHPKFEALMKSPPVSDRADVPAGTRGIYLFSDGPRHLYVGRSNDIRKRHRGHCRASPNSAAFAMRLARQATGLKRDYRPGLGNVKQLVKNAVFKQALDDAVEAVSQMSFRFVAEDDPTRQALLEIYVSVVLATPHNDFDNH
jgi:hypothetical protein